MKLPFAVGTAKIESYILNESHPDGGSKAKFLLAFGFAVDRPDILADALLRHAKLEPVAVTDHGWGPRFAFKGPLMTPDSRNPDVRTIWQSYPLEHLTKFVTLVPLRRTRPATTRHG